MSLRIQDEHKKVYTLICTCLESTIELIMFFLSSLAKRNRYWKNYYPDIFPARKVLIAWEPKADVLHQILVATLKPTCQTLETWKQTVKRLWGKLAELQVKSMTHWNIQQNNLFKTSEHPGKHGSSTSQWAESVHCFGNSLMLHKGEVKSVLCTQIWGWPVCLEWTLIVLQMNVTSLTCIWTKAATAFISITWPDWSHCSTQQTVM